MNTNVDDSLFYNEEGEKADMMDSIDSHLHRVVSSSPDSHPRPEDTKAAAEMVLTLETSEDHPDTLEESDAQVFLGSQSHIGMPFLLVDENEVLLDEEVAAAEDDVAELLTELNATEHTVDGIHTESEPRPPNNRDVLPGAYAVPGPDVGSQVDEVTVNAPSVNPTVAISAQLVDADEESRIVNQRVEQALRKERERASVAQVVSDSDPMENVAGLFSKSGRMLGVIGSIFIATIIIVSVIIVVTREDPTPNSPTTTLSPTPSPIQAEIPTTPQPTQFSTQTEILSTTSPVETTAPTLAPTVRDAPTRAPTQSTPVGPEKFPNLSMSMPGVQSMGGSSWATFDTGYQQFYKAFYFANPQFGVTNVEVKLEFLSQSLWRRLGERQLQDQGLTVVYNQAIAYTIAEGSGLQPADVVTQPFATQSVRDAFASILKDTGDAAFANIQGVSSVSQFEPASAGDDGRLSSAAIIGIVIGCLSAVGLLAGTRRLLSERALFLTDETGDHVDTTLWV